MRYIGLIDDREKTRASLKLSIQLPLLVEGKDKQEWEIIDIAPFKDINDYSAWLTDNEISVLIIDEKLNESAVVAYLGHDVVLSLRKEFPELPIFCITAATREPDLDENYKEYNFILSKDEFQNKRDEFVNLFTKSGDDFYKKYLHKKFRLSELAGIIAESEGTVSDEILKEAEDIQIYLSDTHTVGNITNEVWLKEFSEKINHFDRLIKDIESNLE